MSTNAAIRNQGAYPMTAGKAPRIQALGGVIIRGGLVIVLGWIGAMKFTSYEAQGVQPLVATSPLMSWMYHVLSVQGLSNLLGIVEIGSALLIALRPMSARLSAAGSLIAVGIFLTTLTFLFSLPGWEPTLGGFPALSGSGGFLLKDLVLLGAAVWSLGEALNSRSTGK
jgi:uncharacterized membrane protein YkgB